jgi:hypothetical protein
VGSSALDNCIEIVGGLRVRQRQPEIYGTLVPELTLGSREIEQSEYE